MAKPIDYSKWDTIDTDCESDNEQQSSGPKATDSDNDHAPTLTEKVLKDLDVPRTQYELRTQVLKWLPLLEKLDQHPAKQVNILGASATTVDCYVNVIETFYSRGPLDAAIIYLGLGMGFTREHGFALYKDSFPLHRDPIEFGNDESATSYGCSLLLAFIASDADSQSLSSLGDWHCNPIRPKPQVRTRLAQLLESVKQDLEAGDDNDALTVLSVDLISPAVNGKTLTYGFRHDSTWTPWHDLIIAATKEGIRIFQSFKLGPLSYTLSDWMTRGGSQLRPWSTLKEWTAAFSTAELPSPRFDQKVNEAWKTCFGVDCLAGLKTQDRKISHPYNPTLRVYQMPNVKRENFAKLQWKLNEFKSPKTEQLVASMLAGDARWSQG